MSFQAAVAVESNPGNPEAAQTADMPHGMNPNDPVSGERPGAEGEHVGRASKAGLSHGDMPKLPRVAKK